jgi:hypothetical protein
MSISKVLEVLGERHARLTPHFIDLQTAPKPSSRKLSPGDIRRIRKMQENGLRDADIARRFGVTRQTIHLVKIGAIGRPFGEFGVRSPGYVIDPDSGCWLWFGKMLASWLDSGPRYRSISVRRHLLRREFGVIGDLIRIRDLSVTCGDSRCVNPDHMVGVEVVRHRCTVASVIVARWKEFDGPLLRGAAGVTVTTLAWQYGVPREFVRRLLIISEKPGPKRWARKIPPNTPLRKNNAVSRLLFVPIPKSTSRMKRASK